MGKADGSKGGGGGCVRVRAAEAKALGTHGPAYAVYHWPVPKTVTPAQQEGTEHLVLACIVGTAFSKPFQIPCHVNLVFWGAPCLWKRQGSVLPVESPPSRAAKGMLGYERQA